MSAFMVSSEHINVMVWAMSQIAPMQSTFVFEHPEAGLLRAGDAQTRTQLGQVLLDANAASIMARYDEDESRRYTYRRPQHTSWHPLEIIRAIECFEYQCCEVADYWETPTHALCAAMIKRLTWQATEEAGVRVWAIESHHRPELRQRAAALAVS